MNRLFSTLTILLFASTPLYLVSNTIDPNTYGTGFGIRQQATQIAAANPIPVYAPGNPRINQAGPYGLANDIINGALEIESDNVTLYLKGHRIAGDAQKGYGILIDGKKHITICDGTIGPDNPGAVATGIQVQNAHDITVGNCNFINSNNGIHIEDANTVQITNCKAQGNPANGFSLINTANSTVHSCIATALEGSQNVAGFSSNNGSHNKFQNCTAQSIATTGASGQTAAGIQLERETNSIISQCTLASISAPQGSQASGIHAPQKFVLNDQETSFEVASLALLPVDESTGYVACCTHSGSYITLYAYDPRSGLLNPQATTQIAFDSQTYLYAGSWYKTPQGTAYLAVSGKTVVGENRSNGFVQIFLFDPVAQTLVLHGEQITDLGQTVYSLSWYTPATGTPYLLAGGSSGDNPNESGFVKVFQYDPTGSGALTIHGEQTTGLGKAVHTVCWHAASNGASYLAAGGDSAGDTGFVKVFQYDPAGNGTLTIHGEQTTDLGKAVHTVCWHAASNGAAYLAAGGDSAGDTGFVKVFQYDQTGDGSLTIHGEQTSDLGTEVSSCSWQVLDTIPYLAAGGYSESGYFVKIFHYNPLTPELTLRADQSVASPDTAASACVWVNESPLIFLGGKRPGFMSTYRFDSIQEKISLISSLDAGMETRVHSIAGYFDEKNTPYIAIGGGENMVSIFKYTQRASSLDASAIGKSPANAVVAWYVDSSGTPYLTTGSPEDSDRALQIYRYNKLTNTLTPHGNTKPATKAVQRIAWESSGAPYLAVATGDGANQPYVYIYEYAATPGTLTKKTHIQTTAHEQNINALSWITSQDGKKYLACAGENAASAPGGFVAVYEYDLTANQLIRRGSIASGLGFSAQAATWYKKGRSLYLAIGGYTSESNNESGYVQVYSYNPENSGNEFQLLQAIDYPFPSSETKVRASCLSWVTDLQNVAYLTVGVSKYTGFSDPGIIVHYSFDPEQGTPLIEQWQYDTIAAPFSLFWHFGNTGEMLLAVGGGDGYSLGYLALYGIFPTRCLMQNNLIAGIEGSGTTGIEGNSSYNYIMGNTAYANGKNYGDYIQNIHEGIADNASILANVSL